METLDNRLAGALEYARRHWPVFPVGTDKLPAIKQWEQAATTDPDQIRKWYTELFLDGCNFGFCPGRAGIAVLDLDHRTVNGEAINGETSLRALMDASGGTLPATYTVRTPSGGKHLYFAAAGLRSKNHYLEGVDVKSCGGYVVVPGSRSAKGEYRVENGSDPAELPTWFAAAYGHRVTEKLPGTLNFRAHITPDTPDKITAAQEIIDNWPYAVEGERNEQLYQLARELCKAGVSEGKAVELYTESGIDHIGLDPDSKEVRATISSAYGDGSDLGEESKEGRELAIRMFDALPPAQGEDAASETFGADWTELAAREVPGRRWFIKDWLSADEGYTVLFSGKGGVGKSALVLDLLRSLATGEDWCGMPVLRGGRSMYISCEDSEEELTRRILRRKDGADVPAGVIRIVSRLGRDNALARADRNGVLMATPFYKTLLTQAKAWFGLDGGVLVLDTLSDVFAGNENDRCQVSAFVKSLLNRLGRDLGVTLLVLAHPAKRGDGFSGSTAWEGAFRCRWELNPLRQDKLDGRLTLLLAKSNSTRAGQKIQLLNQGGIFSVGDCAEADESVKQELLQLIGEAYDADQPYGFSAQSTRPITSVKVCDPITGEPLESDEIKGYVSELMTDGLVENFRTNKLRGLRLV